MDKSISLLVTGDFYGGNGVAEFIENGNYEGLFSDFLPVIQSHDLSVINLESALTETTVSIPKTGPAIKASPHTAKFLKDAGFSLATLANNHIMDFGKEGLSDTLEFCRTASIDVVGAGMNQDEAETTYYFEKNDLKIAIINIAENEWSTTHTEKPGAHGLDPVQNYYKITEARKIADYVVMIVHGGHEMYHLPSPRMKDTYRFFIDAGADVVINHHTHCYSGYEVYNGKPIFYSTGNFVFDLPGKKNTIWNSGYAVSLVFSLEGLKFDLLPYIQYDEKTGVRILTDTEKVSFECKLKELNAKITDDAKLIDEFETFQLKSTPMYMNFIEPHNNKFISILQRKGFLPSFIHDRKKLMLLNLIRCEAHRDIVLSVLETKRVKL